MSDPEYHIPIELRPTAQPEQAGTPDPARESLGPSASASVFRLPQMFVDHLVVALDAALKVINHMPETCVPVPTWGPDDDTHKDSSQLEQSKTQISALWRGVLHAIEKNEPLDIDKVDRLLNTHLAIMDAISLRLLELMQEAHSNIKQPKEGTPFSSDISSKVRNACQYFKLAGAVYAHFDELRTISSFMDQTQVQVSEEFSDAMIRIINTSRPNMDWQEILESREIAEDENTVDAEYDLDDEESWGGDSDSGCLPPTPALDELLEVSPEEETLFASSLPAEVQSWMSTEAGNPGEKDDRVDELEIGEIKGKLLEYVTSLNDNRLCREAAELLLSLENYFKDALVEGGGALIKRCFIENAVAWGQGASDEKVAELLGEARRLSAAYSHLRKNLLSELASCWSNSR